MSHTVPKEKTTGRRSEVEGAGSKVLSSLSRPSWQRRMERKTEDQDDNDEEGAGGGGSGSGSKWHSMINGKMDLACLTFCFARPSAMEFTWSSCTEEKRGLLSDRWGLTKKVWRRTTRTMMTACEHRVPIFTNPPTYPLPSSFSTVMQKQWRLWKLSCFTRWPTWNIPSKDKIDKVDNNAWDRRLQDNLWSNILIWGEWGRGKKKSWYINFTSSPPPLCCLPVNVVLCHTINVSQSDFTKFMQLVTCLLGWDVISEIITD